MSADSPQPLPDDALIELIRQTALSWTGIEMPHPAAAGFAADIGGLIRAFDALPPVAFEARPCDFAVELNALADD